jgi:methionine salvage enolase-phosphatase E1
MNKSFQYSCKIYDTNENETKIIQGIIYADNFTNAINKLKYYYDCIETIKIKNVEYHNVYDFQNGTIGFSIIVDENGKIYNE